jgi:HlyD family secretion protein
MTRSDVLGYSLLLPFLIAGICGCGRQATPEAAADTASAMPQVVAAKPERKTLRLSTTQPGKIEAFEQTPLHAKVAGFVEQVSVDIGDVVKKDQVLIRLSIPELHDEVAQHTAQLTQSEAELKQAEAAIEAMIAAADTAESKIVEAEAGISRTEAEHARWQSEYDRIGELAAKGSVTIKLEEETLSQLKAAEAATRETQAKAVSARAALAEAQANIGKARADQGAAAARVDVSKANLGRAKTMLGYTEIKAPYDGTVVQRTVDTGHFVQPAGSNGQPLMVVARTDEVRIFVDVPELEASYVDAGDPVKVRMQALAAGELDSQVVRTSWSLLEANHSLRAEVDVPNPDGLLRPGMYANVTIQLAVVDDALVLPATSIVREGGETFCVVIENDKAVRRPVELGLRSGAEVEIRSGIDENQLVVQKQPEVLTNGQPVRVTPTTAG